MSAKTVQSDGRRVRLIGWLIGLGFAAAAVSQADTQWINRKGIVKAALKAGRYEVEREEDPKRGSIYSSDGKVLAESQDVFEFGLFYNRLPRTPAFFAALASATGKSVDELKRPALLGERKRTWTDPISADRAADVRAVMKKWRADGVSLHRVLRRSYPLAEAASGIIGTVRDGKPVTGLELSQQSTIVGTPGKAVGFVDRTGVFMPISGKEIVEKVNGQDVVLTIDSELQREASLQIRQAVEKHKATSGSVIVYDQVNGDVLAMANWPSYDPQGSILPGTDLNAAYMTRLEPGSTFKILTLALALERGFVDTDGTLDCGGVKQVTNGYAVHCSHGAHGHIDWEKAIGESCNVAAATWAGGIGTDGMAGYIKQLGLLDKPGLGLPGEVRGDYNFKEYAKAIQLANNGFGQAMNATPVSLVSAFGMLANNGMRMKPRLIKSVGGREMNSHEAGQIVGPEVANHVKQLMVSTIESEFGTGKMLKVPGYTLAGKTGTAQKINKGAAKGYVSNFVGFVPAEKPRCTILVMVNDPSAGGYYGGAVAGPVFTEMSKAVIRRYDIAPTPRVDVSVLPDKR